MNPPSPQSFIRTGTMVVPAGQTRDYAAAGQMFRCKEASDVFKMSFNDGAFFDMEVGLGFRLKGEDRFTRLNFRNETASDIVITFFVGVGEVDDDRLNTTIDRLVVVGLKDIPDYSKGKNAAGTFRIAGISGGSNVFSGTDAATGKQRKQLVVQNCDSGYIWILDASDLACYRVGPGESWTVQSSATYKVQRDPTGGNQNFLAFETFWNS